MSGWPEQGSAVCYLRQTLAGRLAFLRRRLRLSGCWDGRGTAGVCRLGRCLLTLPLLPSRCYLVPGFP